MTKTPGVFSLLATAVVGFSTHLAGLCGAARDRLLKRPSAKRRSPKR